MLYTVSHGTERTSTQEVVGTMLDHAHVALTQAVIESLFDGIGRKKEGPIPTPTEFRNALTEVKRAACAKLKRQRNRARADVERLQLAVTALVESRSSVGKRSTAHDNGEDSDESDDGGMTSNAVNVSYREWPR